MTAAHRRYLAVEASVSAAINAVLSAVFVLLVFGGMAMVPVADLIGDGIVQAFAVSLMASLVPSLLTRKRLRAGAIAATGSGAPRNVWLAAVGTAVVAAAVAGLLQWLLLPRLLPLAVPFGTVLVAKVVAGAALGAVVTVHAVRRVLAGG